MTLIRGISLALSLFASGPVMAACSSVLPLQSSAVPTLPGRAIFQGPDSSGNTQLYLFDFASAQQTLISVAASCWLMT